MPLTMAINCLGDWGSFPRMPLEWHRDVSQTERGRTLQIEVKVDTKAPISEKGRDI